MKRVDVFFLIRFFIISLMYLAECLLLGGVNFLLLSTNIFPFIICSYLICIVLSFFFGNSTKQKIKIITDLFFILYFLIMIIISIFMQISGGGDEIFASVCFFLILPMLICFIIWFFIDKKKLNR